MTEQTTVQAAEELRKELRSARIACRVFSESRARIDVLRVEIKDRDASSAVALAIAEKYAHAEFGEGRRPVTVLVTGGDQGLDAASVGSVPRA